jgi:hypothetical protein
MITEDYIWSLLTEDHDYLRVIRDLENLDRRKAPNLEKHHIEPERKRIVWLKPLEHLAIHIAHAKIERNSKFYAKVGAFVRVFPGSHRRQLSLDPVLQEALVSFGQKRPGNGVNLNNHPNKHRADKAPRTKKQLAAIAETGRRTILTNSWHSQGMINTWGDKVSETVRNKPVCCCLLCGREMKALPSNIIQHQRSKKCSDSTKKVKSFKED